MYPWIIQPLYYKAVTVEVLLGPAPLRALMCKQHILWCLTIGPGMAVQLQENELLYQNNIGGGSTAGGNGGNCPRTLATTGAVPPYKIQL